MLKVAKAARLILATYAWQLKAVIKKNKYRYTIETDLDKNKPLDKS